MQVPGILVYLFWLRSEVLTLIVQNTGACPKSCDFDDSPWQWLGVPYETTSATFCFKSDGHVGYHWSRRHIPLGHILQIFWDKPLKSQQTLSTRRVHANKQTDDTNPLSPRFAKATESIRKQAIRHNSAETLCAVFWTVFSLLWSVQHLQK